MDKVDWTVLRALCSRAEQRDFLKPQHWESIQWENTPYLLWKNPRFDKGYLAEDFLGTITLWVFRCSQRKQRRVRAEMCDICKYVHGAGDVGTRIFTSQVSKTRTWSFYACDDLGCRERTNTPGVNGMRETLSAQQKLARLDLNVIDLVAGLRDMART